jgi:hypothetical protein
LGNILLGGHVRASANVTSSKQRVDLLAVHPPISQHGLRSSRKLNPSKPSVNKTTGVVLLREGSPGKDIRSLLDFIVTVREHPEFLSTRVIRVTFDPRNLPRVLPVHDDV